MDIGHKWLDIGLVLSCVFIDLDFVLVLAHEQALQGAPAVAREKEGGLPTTSLEFEYLYRNKSIRNADLRR